MGAVEALEEAAVEEGDVGKVAQGLVRILEVLFVAVERVDAVRGLVLRETFVFGKGAVGRALTVLAHALVQGGEKEVLKDALVVGAGIIIEIDEKLGEVLLAEEAWRDQVLLLEEPAENHPGEEADKRRGTVFFVVVTGQRVGGELHLGKRPEIPVGDFVEELLVDGLNVEGEVV